MLSDEERKAIDELKEEINKPLEVPEDKFDTFILYNIESAKTILNLIKKQSKEIEELKKNKYIIDFKTNEITTLTNDFISKDKIKKYIDEIQKELDKHKIKNTNTYIQIEGNPEIDGLLIQKATLEELIEEEKTMSDEERIEQLELENKVLQKNNKGLKAKIDELQKGIELNKEKIISDSFHKYVGKKFDKEFISKDKLEVILKKYQHTALGDNKKILKFYKELQSLLEKE